MLRLKLPRGNFNLAVMNNLYWSSGLGVFEETKRLLATCWEMPCRTSMAGDMLRQPRKRAVSLLHILSRRQRSSPPPPPKGPFHTKNATAPKSVVFCYRRRFSLSVAFPCLFFPRETSISEHSPFRFSIVVANLSPRAEFTLPTLFSTWRSLGLKMSRKPKRTNQAQTHIFAISPKASHKRVFTLIR